MTLETSDCLPTPGPVLRQGPTATPGSLARSQLQLLSIHQEWVGIHHPLSVTLFYWHKSLFFWLFFSGEISSLLFRGLFTAFRATGSSA